MGKPIKKMKNAFYSILKALFPLKIFRFFCERFGHVKKNGVIRKVRLISKFMMSQSGKQTIAIHIYGPISQEGKAIRQ